MDKSTKSINKNITIRCNDITYLQAVMNLNRLIFRENRLINRMDHDPLVILTAHNDEQLVGFKVGYALSRHIFYSAKGAVLPLYRRQGIATRLLLEMMTNAASMGSRELRYDTFPALYPGMLILGLKLGFHIKFARWNPEYNDFQVRLYKKLK
ncbi:MAG: GNAT family N-acetyltransferase [Balneolales bacterium]